MVLRFRIFITFSVIGFITIACEKEVLPSINPYGDVSKYLEFIPSSPQRSGNPDDGKAYLIYGDYVDSGVPAAFYDLSFGMMQENKNELERTGPHAQIAYPYNLVTAPNGAEVVSPNCLQCHAGYVDGTFVLGLGNNMFDNTVDQGSFAPFLDAFIKGSVGENALEYQAFLPFSNALQATSGSLVTEVVGANPADKLAVVLAAHRNKDDLSWSQEPLTEIPEEVIPADVPAWWLLKKKHAMFSTGIGRKDFARIMMASSILTLQDSAKAREVDNNFDDVQAFINTLEAPTYPRTIDEIKASRGAAIFKETCTKCHGTYGPGGVYPNYLVKHELLKTDSLLSMSNFAYTGFVEWYNSSWFSKGPYAAAIIPTDGYMAPPLDGIWATAPYFHNGSIPTLEDVLNSKNRPSIWRRNLEEKNYDHIKMGLLYTTPSSKTDRYTYDASLRGYGNGGHDFGDHLLVEERSDLLEYLKTL